MRALPIRVRNQVCQSEEEFTVGVAVHSGFVLTSPREKALTIPLGFGMAEMKMHRKEIGRERYSL
jgi:hypothetical protein